MIWANTHKNLMISFSVHIHQDKANLRLCTASDITFSNLLMISSLCLSTLLLNHWDSSAVIWILNSRSKGPMKYPPYICLFLSFSRVFVQIGFSEFLNFLHKVRVSCDSKSSSCILWKNIFFSGFCTKRPKIGFSS